MPKLLDAPLHYRLFVLTVWQGEQDSLGEPGPWRFSLADPRTGGRRGFRSLDQLKRYLDDWIDTLQGKDIMERRIINPWNWQDEYGYVQANEVSGVQRTLYCSGQAANDETGAAVLAGDMRGQIGLALDNLETLLAAAGFTFADIVRLNIFATDVDQFYANYDAFIGRLAAAGCRHTGCLVGVARLAFPEMMVEIEATAVA